MLFTTKLPCKYYVNKDITPWYGLEPEYQSYCTKSGEEKEVALVTCMACEEGKRIEIMNRVREHLNGSLCYFSEKNIVGIWLQGSQNYGLDTFNSDVDTKLIVTPSFQDIALNKTPASSTNIRANGEHTDFKDIRLYTKTFETQNLNFLEILFTDFYIINPLYKTEWERLVTHREEIARMNPYRQVQSLRGMITQKYLGMTKYSADKAIAIDTYGYAPKELYHLLRINEALEKYIEGKSYAECLRPRDPKYLKNVKIGALKLDEATSIAEQTKNKAEAISQSYILGLGDTRPNPEMEQLLTSVQYNIMRISMAQEFC